MGLRVLWILKKGAYFYEKQRDEFWRVAFTLVRDAGSSLKTLTLLADNGAFQCTPDEPISQGVLPTLSGVAFPHSESLTVKHPISFEIKDFGASFALPAIPSLRKLHVISSPVLTVKEGDNSQRNHIHPLLEIIQSTSCTLPHLGVCYGGIEASQIVKILF